MFLKSWRWRWIRVGRVADLGERHPDHVHVGAERRVAAAWWSRRRGSRPARARRSAQVCGFLATIRSPARRQPAAPRHAPRTTWAGWMLDGKMLRGLTGAHAQDRLGEQRVRRRRAEPFTLANDDEIVDRPAASSTPGAHPIGLLEGFRQGPPGGGGPGGVAGLGWPAAGRAAGAAARLRSSAPPAEERRLPLGRMAVWAALLGAAFCVAPGCVIAWFLPPQLLLGGDRDVADQRITAPRAR
jgi:hypothetical protein